MKNLAHFFYSDLVINYAKYMKNGIDKKACYNRFLNAAINLAKLAEPNPFPAEKEMNAATRPNHEGTVVTGVHEDE